MIGLYMSVDIPKLYLNLVCFVPQFFVPNTSSILQNIDLLKCILQTWLFPQTEFFCHALFQLQLGRNKPYYYHFFRYMLGEPLKKKEKSIEFSKPVGTPASQAEVWRKLRNIIQIAQQITWI